MNKSNSDKSATDREKRLREALRANLQRRKSQARGRKDEARAGAGKAADDKS